MKRTYFTLLLIFLMSSASAQYAFDMEVYNFKQIDERSFTFDVRVRNATTPFQPFGLEGIQMDVMFNPALANGGFFQNSQCTYVAGTSELSGFRMIPQNANFVSIGGNRFRWITDNLGLDEETTYFGDANWKRMGTFQVRLRTASTGTTVHNFADVPVNMFLDPNLTGNVVTTCVVYEEEGKWYRATPPFTEATQNLLINSIPSDQETAGYYLSGLDWADANNWNNLIPNTNPAYHQLPGANNNALVGASSFISCPTQVTVDKLYLTSAGSLLLQSTTIGTASLIHNNAGIQATAQRYFPGTDNAWHTLSAPLTGYSILGSPFEPATGDDFYMWHEPSPGTWVNFKNQDGTGGIPSFPVANGGNNFVPGRGYLVSYDGVNPTRNFNGVLTVGQVSVPLSNSSSFKSWDYTGGWNLIGNPYSASLNWNLVDKTLLAESYAQAYNPNKAGGEGYEVISTISPHQGFFVKAASTGNLNFENTHRVHGGTFLKSAQSSDELKFRLSLNDEIFDETTLYFNQQSSANYDFYDATKLFSFNASQPQLYSKSSDDLWLTINSIPSLESQAVYISHTSQAVEMMKLEVLTVSGEFMEADLLLEDLKTGIVEILQQGTIYSFESDPNFANRFLLHFSTVGVDDEKVSNSGSRIYNFGKRVFVESDSDFDFMVHSTSGQVVFAKNRLNSGSFNVELAVPAGVYFVSIKTDQGVYSRKIVL